MKQRTQRRKNEKRRSKRRTKHEQEPRKKSHSDVQRKRDTKATKMTNEKEPQELLVNPKKKSNKIYSDSQRQSALQ